MASLLLSPYKVSNKLELKNRVIMAPMTRRKAINNHTPNEIMVDYYAKRAGAGLIVTEGTLITQDAVGYGNIPGIFTNEHIRIWQKVTDAVHKKNGVIFLQLWHCGRVSHPVFHNGRLPISASATTANVALGSSDYMSSMARAATKSEIDSLVNDYATAALNAMKANFDGVEIHGANGYLVDQFLHYCSNQREDEYGTTAQNMSRFCLQIINACGQSIGLERVGLRLSPGGHMGSIITETRDQFVFSYLLNELNKIPIAYVHAGIFDDTMLFSGLGNKTTTAFLRENYLNTLIASGGYDFTSAEKGIQQGSFNLIALGRPFIANPDLIYRLKENKSLSPYNQKMLDVID